MKKIAAVLASLTICLSSLSAWENVITFGIQGSSPVKIETDDNYHETYTYNTAGFNFGYIGIFDNGLTLKDTFSFGMGSLTSNVFGDAFDDFDIEPTAINVTDIFGIGYSPVRNDNFLLCLFGTIGSSTEIGFAANDRKFEDTDFGVAYAWVVQGFTIGTEITAVYTPTRIFSIFGSLSVNSAIGTMATNVTTKVGDKKSEKTENHDILPYTKIMPSIGMAWRF